MCSESPSPSWCALQEGKSHANNVNITTRNPDNTVNVDDMHVDQGDPHNEVSNGRFADTKRQIPHVVRLFETLQIRLSSTRTFS